MPNDRVPAVTDEQEARIQAGIATDPDNPEITEVEFAQMRPASEVLPAHIYAALTRPRGRPRSDETKVPIKLRLDPSVIEHFRTTGPGWHTRMNTFLKSNETVLRMIVENEEFLDDMEDLLKHVQSGALRVVTEPASKTVAKVERNIRSVKETTRSLREQLVV